MTKAARAAPPESQRSLSAAAAEIGVDRRVLRGWASEFRMFSETAPARFLARDIAAGRALKQMLNEEQYTADQVRALIAQVGADALAETFGRAMARTPPANQALVLQGAIEAAAAAGFFGPVVSALKPSEALQTDEGRVASYARARLAQLIGSGRG